MKSMDEAHREDYECDRLCRAAEEALLAVRQCPRLTRTNLAVQCEVLEAELRCLRAHIVAVWD